MAMDIIEIALDTITDYEDFEKLASEIMKKEGYNHIKPLGGVHDSGRDAIEERLYINKERQTSVFQYTIQSDGFKNKIQKTIKKLIKDRIQFTELVFVCPHKISTQASDSLRSLVRSSYGVSLNIYDRKTLINRLSDYDNGIFYRHFQDIEKQLKNISSRKAAFCSGDDSIHTSLLRAATILAFSQESEKARVSIFDELTFTLIVGQDRQIDLGALSEMYSNAVEINKPSDDSIMNSLKRLENRGLITLSDSGIIPTTKGIERAKATVIEVDESTNSLISDIVDKVCEVAGIELSIDQQHIVARNAKDTLKEYFVLFGIEISNQFVGNKMPSPVYYESTETILKIAKADLPPKVGEYLVDTIADFIANPPESHLQTLINWSLAYLGIQVLNLDPIMQEMEASCLGEKCFILDTDFVLDCIVVECPKSIIYRRLLQDLINLGCRIIIPEAVKNECITHAEHSGNTYYFFKDTLSGFTEDYIERIVWNVFVKGYYYAKTNNLISADMAFKGYLSNYYDEKRPGTYFEKVILNVMPKRVEILNPASILTDEIPIDIMASMKAGLLDLQLKSKKAEYRSKEQNEELAATDAELFLTALYLNKEEDVQESRILGGKYYLITSSYRYLKTAKQLNIRDVVSTRPQSIVSLLELIGQSTIKNSELIKLFENPFLIHAVKESFDDVKGLIEKGVETRGKSIVRLKADLDEIFHSELSTIEKLDQQGELFDDQNLAEEEIDRTLNLLEVAVSKNYQLSPLVKSLYDRLKSEKKKVGDLKAKMGEWEKDKNEIEGKIIEFGKKKQRYLRKMMRRLN